MADIASAIPEPPWAEQPPDGGGADPVPTVDIFISYARPDLDLAKEIAALLRAAGRTVLLQVDDFPTGGRFRQDIDAALRRARHVLALLSKASLDSD